MAMPIQFEFQIAQALRDHSAICAGRKYGVTDSMYVTIDGVDDYGLAEFTHKGTDTPFSIDLFIFCHHCDEVVYKSNTHETCVGEPHSGGFVSSLHLANCLRFNDTEQLDDYTCICEYVGASGSGHPSRQ